MARLRELDPDARVSTISQREPFHRQEHLASFAKGLRLAGCRNRTAEEMRPPTALQSA